MESWRKVWRAGFAPLIPTEGLVALAEALRADDPRLVQGCTTSPPPLTIVHDWPCEAACLIGFAGWQDGSGRATVKAVEECFVETCYRADQRLGEPAGGRWLLNWWDETPRDEARRLMLEEVTRSLGERGVTLWTQ